MRLTPEQAEEVVEDLPPMFPDLREPPDPDLPLTRGEAWVLLRLISAASAGMSSHFHVNGVAQAFADRWSGGGSPRYRPGT